MVQLIYISSTFSTASDSLCSFIFLSKKSQMHYYMLWDNLIYEERCTVCINLCFLNHRNNGTIRSSTLDQQHRWSSQIVVSDCLIQNKETQFHQHNNNNNNNTFKSELKTHTVYSPCSVNHCLPLYFFVLHSFIFLKMLSVTKYMFSLII